VQDITLPRPGAAGPTPRTLASHLRLGSSRVERVADSSPTRERRQLVPLPEPPEGRPQVASQPCEACGSLLDPLRAPLVLAFEDGYRYLCGPECEREFRRGTRARRAPTPVTQRAATPSFGAPKTPSGRAIPLATPPLAAEGSRGLGFAAVAVAGALLLGLFASSEGPATLAAIACAAAMCATLFATYPLIKEVGVLAYGLGPLGALLAAFAARLAIADGQGSFMSMVGASLAAAAVVARAFLEFRSREPLDRALHALIDKLPARVHVPVPSTLDPLAMSVELVDASGIRTGEEVIAMRGETLAVDGVVQVGEAEVLPYPGATSALRRGPGEALLAGARVVNGAVRVLATRVGAERSLLRVYRLASATDRDASALERVTTVAARYGGLFALALAGAVVLLAEVQGPAHGLAVASAVLLAAPLLSLRRAAESPLRAAAAMAGARGIVFQSASALDTVGKVTTVALSPHGVLTETRPVVVEFHKLDGGAPDALIAMAAAAERAAGAHPIALAVERFAEDSGGGELEVRRPVYHPGKGVTAISPQGQPLVIGSRRLLLEEGISVAVADAEAARAEASERTPIFVALDGRVRAVMTLHYDLRAGARPAVQRLFDLGLEVVLLTGDQRGAVQALASGLDIEHVKAELLAEERGAQVRNLREAGGTVAALGRPGEDDAALAAADAGILLAAAGGSAADRAVALVTDDVRDAAAALWIARAAHESAWRGVIVAAASFAVVAAAAAASLVVPAVAAVIAFGVDAFCLPTGARLLQRIARRLPAR
jgi:P-type Cu+ transporter